MISNEKYLGSKEEFYFFLKDEVIKLFKDKLKIEGTRVLIPEDEKIIYEFNYVSDKNYGNLSINVIWGQNPEENKFSEEDIEDDLSMVIDKFLTMD
ncbi:MAG: hypothetical protein MUO60_02750 [Clostridiaceae bacterium]|nr:hypothetical protein [Clostridiaceae bacterium]